MGQGRPNELQIWPGAWWFDEIHTAIEKSLDNPGELKSEREKANKIMFFALDGNAGKRAAEKTMKLLGSY